MLNQLSLEGSAVAAHPFVMRSFMRLSIWGGAFLAASLAGAAARAQAGLPSLPPLPPPSAESAPPPAQSSPPASPSAAPSGPPPSGPPSAAAASPSATVPAAPGQYVYTPPPAGPSALSSAERKHAPAYALWVGGSLGLLAYSGGLYQNDPTAPSGSSIESTGNFVRPGLALQGDVGARLGRRYIPYVTIELGLVGAGHRFDGTPTKASTSFVGIGFRYLAGDVDSISFASDISLGFRKFQVSNDSGTWSASGLEILRLGFGADIRVSTRVTVSPMINLTGGTLTHADGDIAFAPNQPDMRTHPLSGAIAPGVQDTYFAVVLGCNAHVDLFGK